jgi:hypothetical protein
MRFDGDMLQAAVAAHDRDIQALHAMCDLQAQQLDGLHDAVTAVVEGLEALRDLIALLNRKVEAC